MHSHGAPSDWRGLPEAPLLIHANPRSFDSAITSLRELIATLRMTIWLETIWRANQSRLDGL